MKNNFNSNSSSGFAKPKQIDSKVGSSSKLITGGVNQIPQSKNTTGITESEAISKFSNNNISQFEIINKNSNSKFISHKPNISAVASSRGISSYINTLNAEKKEFSQPIQVNYNIKSSSKGALMISKVDNNKSTVINSFNSTAIHFNKGFNSNSKFSVNLHQEESNQNEPNILKILVKDEIKKAAPHKRSISALEESSNFNQQNQQITKEKTIKGSSSRIKPNSGNSNNHYYDGKLTERDTESIDKDKIYKLFQSRLPTESNSNRSNYITPFNKQLQDNNKAGINIIKKTHQYGSSSQGSASLNNIINSNNNSQCLREKPSIACYPIGTEGNEKKYSIPATKKYTIVDTANSTFYPGNLKNPLIKNIIESIGTKKDKENECHSKSNSLNSNNMQLQHSSLKHLNIQSSVIKEKPISGSITSQVYQSNSNSKLNATSIRKNFIIHKQNLSSAGSNSQLQVPTGKNKEELQNNYYSERKDKIHLNNPERYFNHSPIIANNLKINNGNSNQQIAVQAQIIQDQLMLENNRDVERQIYKHKISNASNASENAVYNQNLVMNNNQIGSKFEKIEVNIKDKAMTSENTWMKASTKDTKDKDDTLDNYLNQSIDSNNSKTKEATYFKKESQKLAIFIAKYYSKHHEYPKTELSFYKVGRFLGKGAFGKVNLALHTLSGRLVAMKSFNKKKIDIEKLKRKINFETSILKSLYHVNVVKIYETFETPKFFMITMEYISCGDLLSYVRKRSKLTETVAKFIFKQIIRALKYIHSRGVVHRDIKLDNILIDINSNIKICDFGVAKKFKKNEVLNEQCGTPAYIAPEIFKGNGYEGPPVDVWSSGVVLYAMLSGTVPFKAGKIKELQKIISKCSYNQIKGISSEADDLMIRILEVDPLKRITCEEMLQHPWLSFNEEDLRGIVQLFTDSEKIHLSNDIDFRKANPKELNEAFTFKNLDTIIKSENNKSKSAILAPFNSSQEEEIIKSRKSLVELEVLNDAIKFDQKVRALNKIYELNNNGEIDNGIVISPKALSKNNSYDSDKEEANRKKYNSNLQSKIASRFGSGINSPAPEKDMFSQRSSLQNVNRYSDSITSVISKYSYINTL